MPYRPPGPGRWTTSDCFQRQKAVQFWTRAAMSLRTLNDIFFAIAGRQQSQFVLRKIETGWEPISSEQFAAKVSSVVRILRSWGISKHDRVAILSENRHEWVVADMACLLLGAITVPIYTTLTGEQTARLLRDSGARVIFLSHQKHLDKVASVKHETCLEKIVVMDEVADDRAVRLSEMIESPGDPRLEEIGRAIQPDDLATIINTSGTTGIPKGIMLTHGNMSANINFFLCPFGFREGMQCVSFLPLSHVTARSVDLGLLHSGVTLAHLPVIEQLPRALLEIRPHILLSVPRVYEKLHAQVELKAEHFPSKQIYRWALRVGRAHRAEILAGQTPRSPTSRVANRLVFAKIRDGIGGSVGKPLSNVEVRIAEDGEILVRGPSVFQGYWNKPDETRAAFVDGWFRTGDIGRIDEDGFLYVTDRKKDLLKTSGGKFIAPQPIESALKHHPLVAEAVVVGDKRKFPAVLIFPNFAVLEARMREKHLTFSSREELVELTLVRQRYAEIISEVNAELAQFEKLKEFRLITEEPSATTGTMTASMKLRRRAIEDHFRHKIEEIYAGS